MHDKFQPGLKLKSEVDPGRTLSVAFIVLAFYIFVRASIVFLARAEIFSCDYKRFFSPGSSNPDETLSA